jgi:hypothetical protein
MGAKGEERVFALGTDLWGEDQKISDEENWGVEVAFTAEELDEVLASMKPDFPVLFFKRFWGILREPILQMLNDFALGRVDIARLNYGAISLIPKVKGTDCIK